MEKLVHSIALETFMYPSEDAEKVAKAIDFIFPGKKAKSELIESYSGSKIQKLTVNISKSSELKKLLKTILGKISKKDRQTILDTLDQRIDEEGNVFIRFSKQDAYNEKFVLQYKGDVVKLKIKIAAFPFSIEKAEENLVKIFESI